MTGLIRAYRGRIPRIGSRVFVAETAAVIGDVCLGDGCSVWYGASVRGDINSVTIGKATNIQDCVTVHVTTDTAPVFIGDFVTVGHNAILHGCTIEDDVIIGMGAIILDNAHIGRGSIIGAGALVTQKMVVPPRSLVLGAPAKVRRQVTDDETESIAEHARHYVEAARYYLDEPVT